VEAGMTLPYDYSHCADHQGARHTPGSLSIKPAKDGSGDYAIISDEGHGLIAECFADMRYANERATEIAKANASFFAAGVLLAALAGLAGCESDATVASRNLSKAADNTEAKPTREAGSA